jgi:hypothetical protein
MIEHTTTRCSCLFFLLISSLHHYEALLTYNFLTNDPIIKCKLLSSSSSVQCMKRACKKLHFTLIPCCVYLIKHKRNTNNDKRNKKLKKKRKPSYNINDQIKLNSFLLSFLLSIYDKKVIFDDFFSAGLLPKNLSYSG